MYQVLLAVDGDEQRAINMASAVTGLPDASRSVEVTVLHVFENVEAPPAAAVQEPPHRGAIDGDDGEDEASFPSSVERACEVFANSDVSYVVRGEQGDPDQEILAVADDISADVIYLGGKKRSPTGKVLFGSVTQDVVFNTDLPVTIAGATEP